MSTNRRNFLQTAGAALALLQNLPVQADAPKGPLPGAPLEGEIKIPPGNMPMRRLGRTGVKVSLLGIGGFHIGVPKDDKEAIRIVHSAMDHGVNFLDNCWDYNTGKSEERMGRASKWPHFHECSSFWISGRTPGSGADSTARVARLEGMSI